jgi:hypothetical protein
MSWNGTVRCSVCYENGHNKTSCPTLRKAWEEDPTSYRGRTWERILARKAAPKTCGYCGEEGHTRAGCGDMKAHKSLFAEDLLLWRHAMVKWMQDVHLGIGALVRCSDAQYHDPEWGYIYPRDENYIPPVGMIMRGVESTLTHYCGIMNTGEWCNGGSILCFERIGAPIDQPSYQRTVGVTLPCIPGIVPRYGRGYYGSEKMDRAERLNNVDWEVVSPGQTDFSNDEFVCPKNLKKATKTHFAAPQDHTTRTFKTFTDFQRKQLQQYINCEIELSEMKDPEVPLKNT